MRRNCEMRAAVVGSSRSIRFNASPIIFKFALNSTPKKPIGGILSYGVAGRMLKNALPGFTDINQQLLRRYGHTEVGGPRQRFRENIDCE